jgi:UDP-N-acetylmuramate dehydrogenase
MNTVRENVPLTLKNTFGVEVQARYYAEFDNIQAAREILKSTPAKNSRLLITGSCSNILFTGDFEGMIIHPAIHGIEVVDDNPREVVVKVGAGEPWDDIVKYCVENNWGGLENLSLIPGTVGACPVQNIGAYGTEVGSLIDSVEALQLDTGSLITLDNEACQFGYRNSIFKGSLRNLCAITHVTLRLSHDHRFITSYPDLQVELDNYPETTIQNIRDAVIAIRRRKLPDPSKLGNAGSFFKNPTVDHTHFVSLRNHFPQIKGFENSDGSYKLSAAWLLQTAGWKGKRIGQVGTHKTQPLIIVNYGNATGEEIMNFAQKAQKAVINEFGIKLEMEVNVY